MWNLPSANFYGSRGGGQGMQQPLGRMQPQNQFQQPFPAQAGLGFGNFNSSIANVQFGGGRQGLWGSVGGGLQQGQTLRGQMTNSIGMPYQMNQMNQMGQQPGLDGYGQQIPTRPTYYQPQNNSQALPIFGGGGNYMGNNQGWGALQNSIAMAPQNFSPFKAQGFNGYQTQMQRLNGSLQGVAQRQPPQQQPFNGFQPQNMQNMQGLNASRGNSQFQNFPQQMPQGFSPARGEQPFNNGQWGEMQNSISKLPTQPFPVYSGRKMNTETNDYMPYPQNFDQFQGYPPQQPRPQNPYPQPPRQQPQQPQHPQYPQQPQFSQQKPQHHNQNPYPSQNFRGGQEGFAFNDPKLDQMYKDFKASNSVPQFDFYKPNFEMPPPTQNPYEMNPQMPFEIPQSQPHFEMPPPFIPPSSGSKPQAWGSDPWSFPGNDQPQTKSPPFISNEPPQQRPKTPPPPAQEKFETPQKTIQTLDAYQQLCNQYANND